MKYVRSTASIVAPILLLLALASCKSGDATPASALPARVLMDSAGREIALPAQVTRVLPAGTPAAILLYTLAPDTMLGWPRCLKDGAAAYVPEPVRGLPEIGRLSAKSGSLNLEVALGLQPELFLDYGSLADSYVSLADRVQTQTGVPYVLLDGSFEAIPDAYRRLGRILAREERAEKLARYAEGVIRDMRAAAARVGDNGPRVYHARGRGGLQTGRAGALNTELLGFVGARNVAGKGEGLTNVSVEDLLRWDPEHVVTVEPDVRESILGDERWGGIRAVRSQHVHLAPTLPFGWVDRPPSVNRLIGVRWLLAKFYPESADELGPEVKIFYRLFYDHELTDEQLASLLGPSR